MSMNNSKRFICFELGKEEFSIPLSSVKEVIGIPEVTPIPQSPTYFLGIMNLRGSIISVIDLRLKLGIKAQPSEETGVIILDLDSFYMGVIVDKVSSVVTIPTEEISEKPTVNSSISTDFIDGIFRKDDHLVLILDVTKALSIEDKNAINKTSKLKAA